MSNANRDYAIVYDVKNSSLVLSRPLIFYITDKNTSNIFVRLVTKVNIGNGVDQYTDIEKASNYVLTMRVIKPNNEVKSIEATQHKPESIFQFDLTEDFKDIPGKYICELTISTIVSSRQELITSDPFSYEVKRSILSNVGEIIETEGITTEKILNDLEATKSELSSQIKDIENKLYYITPKNFGDDIQSTIEYAKSNNINIVCLEGKEYVVYDSILLYSNMTLEGIKGKTTIKMTGVDKPIISKKGSILGNTHIKNIEVIGDETQSNNHGIVLNDYYSSIVNCIAYNCGGCGFYISDSKASGTLVENRIENCKASRCIGTSFYLGAASNKITDGFLVNCISQGSHNNMALYIGSAAGWNINGLHTYAHDNSDTALRIMNSYNTIINNIYIEDFSKYGMNLHTTQNNLNISNINICLSDGLSNAEAIALGHSTASSTNTKVNISNIHIKIRGSVTDCSIFGGDNSAYTANISNLSIDGNEEGLNIIKPGISEYRHNIIYNARVTGKLHLNKDITEDTTSMIYNGYKIPYYKSGKISDSGEKTLSIPLMSFNDYAKILVRFSIYTSSWDTGSARMKYTTELMLSAKNNASCTIYRNDLFEPVGFTNVPVFSVDRTTNVLTITFTSKTTDDQGIWVCEMYYL